MTDLPGMRDSVPNRLGVTARFVDGQLLIDLAPRPEVLHFGVVRASVIAYAVDCVAGIAADDDDGQWTMTSDMTVRMRAVPAPALITSTSTVLRSGRRSITCQVECTTDDGAPIASGAIGFVRFPRREGDPPKPVVTPEEAAELMPNAGRLSHPLRDEVGIQVIDAAAGVVEVLVTPELRNPAGTMQGAMVALVAEAAAEELAGSRAEGPVVVTDLDIRYLAQAPVGPVRSNAQLLGEGADAPIRVELVDTSTGKPTTLVYARAVSV